MPQKPAKRSRVRAPDGSKKTPERVAAFLEGLAETGRVSQGALRAKVSRKTVYAWRKIDAEFAAAWDEAEELGVGLLEDEAVRRALEGVTRPALSGGSVVRDANGRTIMLREYSDTLLAMLLRAKRPAIYRERVEHGGKVAFSFSMNLGDDGAGS